MTQQNINIGTAEQTGDGESIRSAFSKIEDNFTELYTDVAANAQAAIEVNDLTSSVTWANVPDANITQSSVTQHQASLALTASQVSDFVSVVQANEINDLTGTVTWANVPDANITESSVTQHQEALAITLSQITDIGSNIFLTNIQNESIGDLSDVDLTGIANGSILSWNSTSGKFEIAPIGIQLTSLSVTAPAEAFGSGGVDYNNVSGTFTYTPPDLSTYLTAESDTFQTVTSRGSTTTNTVDFQSGVIATAVSSSNAALHSIGFNEANPMGIGSTIGVNIVGGAGAPINIGTSPSGTVTIGSGSNLIDFTSGTTVDFTGATITGLRTSDDAIILGNGATAGAEAVSIGKNAGDSGDYSQAIGNNAGNTGQGVAAVALGSQSGETSQGDKAVAVGQYAGQTTQGSQAIAIGNNAGKTTQSAVAVAIGTQAGMTTQGLRAIAIGLQAAEITQAQDAIAIGSSAGYNNQGQSAIAIGAVAGNVNQAARSIVISASNVAVNNIIEDSLVITPIRSAVGTTMLMYDAGTGEVTHTASPVITGDITGSVFGDDSTVLVDGNNNKIVGAVETSSLRTSETKIALGSSAGVTTQGIEAIAIGKEAGKNTQGDDAVAVGSEAGEITQGIQAVAIGKQAGNSSQSADAVAVGYAAGKLYQGIEAIALGKTAGYDNQGDNAVAVGYGAGSFTQGDNATALGFSAGYTGQGADAIAIGRNAGYSNQAANSIVINATGEILSNTQADAFIVKPVRNDTMTTILGYDAGTGEVTHNAAIPGYTNTADLKALVAASTDFTDFQARIAAL